MEAAGGREAAGVPLDAIRTRRPAARRSASGSRRRSATTRTGPCPYPPGEGAGPHVQGVWGASVVGPPCSRSPRGHEDPRPRRRAPSTTSGTTRSRRGSRVEPGDTVVFDTRDAVRPLLLEDLDGRRRAASASSKAIPLTGPVKVQGAQPGRHARRRGPRGRPRAGLRLDAGPARPRPAARGRFPEAAPLRVGSLGQAGSRACRTARSPCRSSRSRA